MLRGLENGVEPITEKASWLNEAILDALDDMGVNDELLEQWALQEKRGMLRGDNDAMDDREGLPVQVRQPAQRLLTHMAKVLGLPDKCAAEADTLLDVYCN